MTDKNSTEWKDPLGCIGRAIGILGIIPTVVVLIGTMVFWGKYDTYSAREGRLFIGEIVERCGRWNTIKWTVGASLKSEPPECASDSRHVD